QGRRQALVGCAPGGRSGTVAMRAARLGVQVLDHAFDRWLPGTFSRRSGFLLSLVARLGEGIFEVFAQLGAELAGALRGLEITARQRLEDPLPLRSDHANYHS